mgnify:CR=1 FL=1
MNVLIVEDEKGLSHEMEIFLTKQGFNCDVAFNGHAASERIFVNDYDFILYLGYMKKNQIKIYFYIPSSHLISELNLDINFYWLWINNFIKKLFSAFGIQVSVI